MLAYPHGNDATPSRAISLPRPSPSAPQPKRSSRARSAGTRSSPSAPPATAGSASTPTPSSPTAPISASPDPGVTPAATTAPEPASDAKAEQDEASAVQQSRQNERELAILDALSQGVPYREISATHRISLGALTRIAQRHAELESGAVAKLMSFKALDAVSLWEAAMIKASEQGKHTPMKDWLTHAKVLDPVNGTGESGPRVAVIIGTPGQPIDLPSVQVVDITADSSE